MTAAPYSLLEDRQCSVVGGDCICSWTAHYAVPYLALLRHRKKYENMIYSSGLGPSWDWQHKCEPGAGYFYSYSRTTGDSAIHLPQKDGSVEPSEAFFGLVPRRHLSSSF